MPHHPEPSRSPYNLSTEHSRWLYVDGVQVPIVSRSRRNITIVYGPERVTLKRSRLERTGFDTVDGRHFCVSSYPIDQQPHEGVKP